MIRRFILRRPRLAFWLASHWPGTGRPGGPHIRRPRWLENEWWD